MPKRNPNKTNINIDNDAALLASRDARMALDEVLEGSCILDPEREGSVPRYAREQLVLGSFLGRGGFNDVFEVKIPSETVEAPKTSISLRRSMALFENSSTHGGESANYAKSQSEDREQSGSRASIFRRKRTPDTQYAVKFLSLATMSNPSSFAIGAADLVIEGHFLASFDHPNIIKLRGVSSSGIEGLSEGRGGGYFLILDQLVETLDVRLDKWLQKSNKSGFFSKKKVDQRVHEKKHRLLTSSLIVASDIASALQYLHERNVIYRDLKPENVGFDSNDDVKLFDFGLAKELRAADRQDDGLYNLTGNTGSLRYMSPEVGSSMPYDLSADVYSFSVLLWELCTLEKPFSGMTPATLTELVINGPYRPSINEDWPIDIRKMMEQGWSSNVNERPLMDTYYTVLVQQVAQIMEDGVLRADKNPKRVLYSSKSM
mmetsp:Transcript_26452/g.38330  ORF Transcript_26452/g.38330 Transcript_26452/m.38330 type:complete len:432 (+) Transcript_26452:150-1445(+)